MSRKMITEKILKFKERLFLIFGPTRERFLLNIIKYGTYLSLLTPLIFSKSFFPPPLPPTIFFRLVVDVILIAYVILLISNTGYRPKFNVLTITVSLFLGILILTSFTGVNLEKSIWGNFERMGGVITFIHLFGFFIVLSSVFKERKDWERIFTVSIFVGVLVVFLIIFSSQFSLEEGGTLWNSSFLASYLLFDIYFALILFLTKGGICRIFYGGSLAVLLPALFLSGCRGAIVSFCVGLFLLALGYFIFFKRKLLRWFLLGIFLILVIFGSILFFTKPNFVEDESKIILENLSLQTRFFIWQIGWEGWQERFLFGWGPENFDVVFFKHFNPKLAMAKYGGQVSFDRAHNIILDIGVTSGIFGALSYLAIFVVAILVLFKKIKESLSKDEAMFLLGMTIILVVYFLQNLLLLDVINSYVMFFLILAFIGHVLEKNRPKESKDRKVSEKSISSWLGGILIIFIILMAYFGNVQAAKSSFYISRATNATLKESVSLFQKSFRIHSMSQLEGSKYFYNKVMKSLSSPNIDREAAKKDLQVVEEELEKNIKKNPLDFYLHIQLADIYIYSFWLTRDGEKLVSAESALREAITLSPENQQGYWKLADVMSLRGRHKEQFELLQKAIDLEPYLSDSLFYLEMAYVTAGETDLSRKNMEYAAKIYPKLEWGRITMDMMADFYRHLGDNYSIVYVYQEAVKYDPTKALFGTQEYLKYNPQDLNAQCVLFLAYAKLGEIDKAKELRGSILRSISESGKADTAIILQSCREQLYGYPGVDIF